MRLATGLLTAISAVAGLASVARAGDDAPYLGDLRAAVAARDDALTDPATRLERKQKGALGRARDALDGLAASGSSSMQEDAAALARAAAALWSAFRDDAGMNAVVRDAFNLYFWRLDARHGQLKSAAFEDLSADPRRLLRILDGVRRALRQTPAPTRSWSSTARMLLKAAAGLDAAAVELGVSPAYTFVQASVTATIDGVARSWRMADAHFVPGPGTPGLPDTSEFVFSAFSSDPASYFLVTGMRGPAPAAVYHGGFWIGDYGDLVPMFSEFEPGTTQYDYDPGQVSDITLAAFDPAAGTASGTFTLRVIPAGTTTPIVIDGQFTVTSGMETW